MIDDAQWLDRASRQALAFVARRLLAERIAMVFAVREPTDADELDGLPELVVDGLADDDARTVLASGINGPLDTRVRDRILAETRGNPLALLELPRGLTPAELAGGFGLPDRGPLSGRIERSFLRRFESLPSDSRQLLLLAAAEPTGDVPLLWRAAERLGIGADAAGPAEAAELLELGARVRFRHPLVRSAIYRAATQSEREAVHRALAETTDPEADPDRRAWHRAHAAAGLDEAVAGELERSAGRAQARGGIAAAAAFLERAAELTPDPAQRGTRALAAAQAKLDAGAPEAAEALLATAELAPLDELQRARLERLRAKIAFARTRGRDAPALLLDAARRLEPLDAAMARETHLEAMAAAMFAGRLGGTPGVREAAEAAQAAPPAAQPPRAVDLLLDGLATRFTEGYAAGCAAAAQRARRVPPRGGPDGTRRALALAGVSDGAGSLGRRALARARDAWAARRARDGRAQRCSAIAAHVSRGAPRPRGSVRRRVLADRGDRRAHAGDRHGTAEVRVVDAARVARRRGRGASRCSRPARRRGDGAGRGHGAWRADWATALLHNGNGRYAEALAAAQRGCEHDDVGLFAWCLVELIEAGVRSGATDAASAALERLSERTQASGTDWALGIEAGSRALLSDGPGAEPLYREAVERLERTRGVVHVARAQLLYGEWLRREQRRVDAREQLRAAHETFSRIGAEGFAERARRELSATGETVRRLTVETRDLLTPQEALIAGRAVDGQTNPEIGAELFISPRTVEYHLHKVFTKLGIGSRKELRAALAGAGGAAAPA